MILIFLNLFERQRELPSSLPDAHSGWGRTGTEVRSWGHNPGLSCGWQKPSPLRITTASQSPALQEAAVSIPGDGTRTQASATLGSRLKVDRMPFCPISLLSFKRSVESHILYYSPHSHPVPWMKALEKLENPVRRSSPRLLPPHPPSRPFVVG